MIWGSICIGASTELVIIEDGFLTAQWYITDILESHIITFALFFGDD